MKKEEIKEDKVDQSLSFICKSMISVRTKRQKYLDISFESDDYNIYDPYFSSEPSDEAEETETESESESDSYYSSDDFE